MGVPHIASMHLKRGNGAAKNLSGHAGLSKELRNELVSFMEAPGRRGQENCRFCAESREKPSLLIYDDVLKKSAEQQ